MNTYADKTPEIKKQSVTNLVTTIQGRSESTFPFVDNRAEAIAQRKLQEMANNSPAVAQLKAFQDNANNNSVQQGKSVQKKENNTGLPDNLKSGIENLSGYSMDDVKVHYNSANPAQLQAYAYAQGTDIHIASGQEKHLPHEAWHVVQQKQGRVNPTMQMKGKVNVNDDAGLEKEADVMGAKAIQVMSNENGGNRVMGSSHEEGSVGLNKNTFSNSVVQRFIGLEFQMLRSDITLEELQGGDELNGWELSDDGSGAKRNLEMETTEFFTDESELTRTVTEMATLGKRVEDSTKGDVIDIGNHRITVKENDNSGQPQVTFDLALSSFGPDLASKSEELMGKGYFDADMPGFGWSKEKTSKDIKKMISFLAKTEEFIPDKVINSQYGKIKNGNIWPSELYAKIRAYLAARFTQNYQSDKKEGGGLTKDVHLLLKTDTKSLVDSIIDDIARHDQSSGGHLIGAEDYFLKQSNSLLETIGNMFGVKTKAGDMHTNLYDDPRAARVSQYDKNKLGAVLELRRVPVKNVSEWVPFAIDAFTQLNDLFNPKFDDDDSSSSSSESDDDFSSYSDSDEDSES
ncbi:DUF4157 domain-containing protein [Pedobacter nyackensis]|uniref:eCIS core domain-containing protein n=1 Tax=Pedobacter nyackensis TaxID=475255 RepID=UPI002931F0D9|nr:DUF4157 domain-containing protein [Pedobacter nyackensis]